MKPSHKVMLVILVAGIIAFVIWKMFQKAPAFDIAAYNRLGQQGIVKRFGDYPYCANCVDNNEPDAVSNGINYKASTVTNDPTALARERAILGQTS